MRVKFYLLPIILFLCFHSSAQDCSSVTINCTATESRCVATGSITVSATGGSGNFNYRATGPITTPVTSSNVITGLPGGYYTIRVTDITNGCSKELAGVFVPGTYQDPRFQLTKTDGTCSGNDGTISAINVQYGRSPFTYTIIAPSPASVGATNSTGNFTGLPSGEYYVQLRDSCGGIQVRAVTIENYSWWIDGISVTRLGCDSANVAIFLEDNKGNTNSAVIGFSGFNYGVVITPGDTTWFNQHDFNVYIGTHRNLTVIVKDGCGNMEVQPWTLPPNLRPSLGNPSMSNLACATFTATVTGQNLTSPQYCAYDSNDNLVECNTTGIFANLPYGSYCIEATDLCYDTVIARCFTTLHAVPAVAANVNISAYSCTGFTATITGKQNLTTPDFCLYNNANVLIECNATGVFTNVPYGSYCIRVEDGCIDTVISRCFTVARPIATLTNYSITGSNCSTFNVSATGSNLNNPTYCLFDSNGNVIECNLTGVFTGIDHGNYCIRAISCGDTTNSLCFGTSRPIPTVAGTVQINNRDCNTFSATITGQANLTDPLFCLLDSDDNIVECNETGVFNNIPYGSYCIRIRDNCYDTTIKRCFSQAPSVPTVNATVQLLSSACATVSFKANGTNLISPTYHLYDANEVLLETNSTGTFSNYPYGTYCIDVADGCYDTTIRVCRTFTAVTGISLTTSKSCTIGNANVDVQFANGNTPYLIEVYHPNGSLVYTNTTSTNPFRIQLGALPAGTQYKIVGTDNCGNKDSSTITPDANIVTRSVTVRAKCPSSTWLNGAGDLLATCPSNFHSVLPKIIKKNGVVFNKNHSSVTSGVYNFADLEPATYIVEYTQSSCNGKLYDTVTVPPYAYPSQGQSAIYQCDNNAFSLGADVQGGVSPYSFQIIGSLPSSPDISTTPQASPVFTINTGTTYSLVRLRTLDACGNATLSDVSVLPLQNISITASDSCFFQDITLSVDTIPNALYLWYRKTSPGDSVLLDTSLTYNLPFFVPEEVGEYICKMIVNDGCITRLSYFTLDGGCGMEILPVDFKLKGKVHGTANQLSWANHNEAGVQKYIIERKAPGEGSFQAIGTIPAGTGGSYVFNDNQPGSGTNHYRLKLLYVNKIDYTNVISLKRGSHAVQVYPNPVSNVLTISLSGEAVSSYNVELINAGGQLIYSTQIKNIQSTVFTYRRDSKTKPGIYLLKITDVNTNTVEIRKLIFE